MQFLGKPDPLIVIVGPTAVGKTALSIEVARQLNAEIISADSRLFYRGMDIGTAKPTIEERNGVPHHLIDVADPAENWSLALFQSEAQKIILDIHARNRLPILVGGTGQYIRAVIEGWKPPAANPDDRLRTAINHWVEQIGPAELHRKLSLIDPAAAQAIDARNVRRTVRAWEVIFSSGRLFSNQRTKGAPQYSLLLIGLHRPRPELYARIDARIDSMLQSGFLDEVRALLTAGYGPELAPMSAIGYRQMVAVLQGELTLAEAVTEMKRLTRIFVRRQANWFKADDPVIHWFDAGNTTAQQVIAFLHSGEGWLGIPTTNQESFKDH